MINTYQTLKALCAYAPTDYSKPVLNGVHIHRPNEQDVIFEASDGVTAIRVLLNNHDSALMFLPVGTDVVLRADSLAAVDEDDNPPLLVADGVAWVGGSRVELINEPYVDIVRAMCLGKSPVAEATYLDLNLVTAVTQTMIALGDGQSVAKFETRGKDESVLITLGNITAVIMTVRN